jgi:hypothetical protein
MGQLALSTAGAIVGGVAGSFFGMPMLGAELGWMLGGIAGAMIFRQKGPQPADIRVQDSAYGKAIPIVYGVYRVAGNIIWAGQPYVQDAGKGGKGPQQTKVAMSFAVALCDGPITGVRRIWANGKLIYDMSNPSNFQAVSGSNTMVTNFTVYPGDENQLPDPTMQAALGVNATPAHRGLAYVVFNNLDLSNWGNYLPSLSFEVMATAPLEYVLTGQTSTTQHPVFGSNTATAISVQTDAAGNAYGFQVGLDSLYRVEMAPYKLSPWGTTWLSTPFVLGSYWPVRYCQSYDEQGILVSNGEWYGVTGPMFNTNISTYIGGTNASAIKRNGAVYVTTFVGMAKNPIQIYVGGANYTGNTAAAWRLVGVSSTYVYAVGIDASDATYGNWLCQFDLFGNLVAKLVHDAVNLDLTTAGYCVSDTQLYLNGASTVKMWNGSALIDTGIPADTSGNLSGFAVQNSTAYFTPFAFGSSFYAQVAGFNAQMIALSSVVADLCNRAGLTNAQYDVTSLTDQVWGYAITNHSTARSNLTPLMTTYFFDACDTDGLIRFVRRGQPPFATFAYADLGASPSIGDTTNTNPITQTIAQEVDLPRTLTLTYSELDSDYNPNTQRASRALSNSNKDLAVQAPFVLARDEALMRAQTILWSTWVGRKTFKFTTGLQYLAYEPGDVATIQDGNGETHTARITRCQYDGQGTLLWEAALEEPDIYPSPAYTVQGGAAAGFAHQTIDYSGPTILAVLDVPPLQDTDTTQGLYLAACGMSSKWPGAMVDISRDDVTFSQAVTLGAAAVIGYANGALPAFGGGNQPDELSTVSVTLYSGALASCTYANFLAGMNAAYLGGELILFRNATQTAANTYTLSGLLRGRVGTEWAMSTHVTGETFVLLDRTRIASMPVLLTDIKAAMYFETYLLNLFGSTPSAAQKVVPTVARVKPLSPALFVAGPGSAASTSDISLSWIRRARVSAQWLDGTDVPLDESSESYQLQVLNSSTVVRTVTVAGTGAGSTYTYTAANITADGFSTGNTISFTVAQNSDQGVLGYAATTSIVR